MTKLCIRKGRGIRIRIVLMTIGLMLLSLGSKAQPSQKPMNPKNILIVYLSRTQNTKAVAELIQKNVGGKIFALELATPYPSQYHTMVDQVASENQRGYLPPLRTKIDRMASYDVVFVGFPTWGMQLPPPMKSFLSQYDLSGKTVVPFNTHAGYGVGSGFETVQELCAQSQLKEGFSIQGGIERDGILYVMEGQKLKQTEQLVKSWLQKIGML